MDNRLPKVLIIILTWNNYEDTAKCLKSLELLDYPDYEILVVDNGSTDGSIQKIQQEFPNCYYLLNKANYFYSKGTNLGIKYALSIGKAKYFFLLNNDTEIIDPQTLTKLVSVLQKNRDVSGCCCRAVYPDGSPQNNPYFLEFPSLLFLIRKDNFFRGIARKLNQFFYKNNTYDNKYKCKIVDWIPTGISLFKRQLFTQVLFNEMFPMDFSDVEFCKRASLLGHKFMYCHNVPIVHTNNYPNQILKSNKNFLRAKKAEILFIKEFHKRIYVLIYKLLLTLNSFFYCFFLALPALLLRRQNLKDKFKNHCKLICKIFIY